MSNPLPPPPLNGPISDGYGNATPALATWLTALWNRTGGAISSVPDNTSQYVINIADPVLPNAQNLSSLHSGFVKVTQGSGILTSSGHTTIQNSDLANNSININGQDIALGQQVQINPTGPAGGGLNGSYPNPGLNINPQDGFTLSRFGAF